MQIWRKTSFLLIILVAGSYIFNGCDKISPGITEKQAQAGLKEALRVGTDTSVSQAHEMNGYYYRLAIKIDLPPEAKKVEAVVKNIPGGQTLLDELVKKLNRAAEEAAIKARPIFIDAIGQITINDALTILNGSDDAATEYLSDRTFEQLYLEFKPDIENALVSVGAQQSWNELITLYNDVPFVDPVNADLADHTTNKGLEGLFHLVAKEERKIRTNAEHRVNQILEEVFGN